MDYSSLFIQKLWARVDKRGPCWLWLGCTARGYGRVAYHGKMLSVHRIAFELAFGSIPDGLLVCHRCDNPTCCNPEHLFLGTQKDNMIDMVRKSRNKSPCGADNGNSKLSSEMVQSIREQHKHGAKQKDLAKQFGCDQSLISLIINKKIWRHL